MNVYTGSDGCDHVIAENAEDAQRVHTETYGEPNDLDSPISWELVSDDKPITISYEDESEMPAGCQSDLAVQIGQMRPRVTLTAKEWVSRSERGLLCSQEW